jgi:hypothetical protein
VISHQGHAVQHSNTINNIIVQDGIPARVRKARMLKRQQHFIEKLGQTMKTVAQYGGNRKKKVVQYYW